MLSRHQERAIRAAIDSAEHAVEVAVDEGVRTEVRRDLVFGEVFRAVLAIELKKPEPVCPEDFIPRVRS